MATCFWQNGPADRTLRLIVDTAPFLLAADLSWSPDESVVSVGVELQSESETEAPNGSCQELTYCRFVAFRATIACDWVWVKPASVPVDRKMVLVAASYVGDVQTPPPTCPLGTKL